MRSGSLFTGTGALDMAAAEVLGADPAWFCDVDPGASALLAHHYPEIPNLGDITAVDWTTVEPVEVLTGGFPCQDISNAGKREGITGARSGLWSYYADAIRVLRPRYVLIENVAALIVRGLDRVLADLAALGFDAEWATVRASDVGAPHQRERIFIAAARHPEMRGRDFPSVAGQRRGPAGTAGGPGIAASDTAGAGFQGDVAPRSSSGAEPQADADAERNSGASTAHSDRGGVREQPVPFAGRRGSTVAEQPGADVAAHSDGDERERQSVQQPGEAAPAGDRDRLDWAGFAPAIHRWEAIVGRPAPVPTVLGARGGRVLNPALVEWMMGLPDGWITAVPGLSRAAQLKLAGNGVVPHQAIAAYRYLLDLDARSAA